MKIGQQREGLWRRGLQSSGCVVGVKCCRDSLFGRRRLVFWCDDVRRHCFSGLLINAIWAMMLAGVQVECAGRVVGKARACDGRSSGGGAAAAIAHITDAGIYSALKYKRGAVMVLSWACGVSIPSWFCCRHALDGRLHAGAACRSVGGLKRAA